MDSFDLRIIGKASDEAIWRGNWTAKDGRLLVWVWVVPEDDGEIFTEDLLEHQMCPDRVSLQKDLGNAVEREVK
jgi:hypothetical protein